MGVVYEAWQLSLNRRVALKRLRYAAFATEKALLRFKAEAEVIATLDHPNIVPIYEIGEYQGESYFSMKLFEGKDLRSRLADFRDQPRAVARLVATIARAVQYAHQRGVLHRDLKPSNILLDVDDQPQLIDFGLARRIDQEGEGNKDGVVGTPNFMAPEQAAGRSGATTSLSDVYGLGGILYSLLTGRPPFQGSTTEDVLKHVIEDEPAPPSQLNPGIDGDLEVICLKCLSEGPGSRGTPPPRKWPRTFEHWLALEPILAARSLHPVRANPHVVPAEAHDRRALGRLPVGDHPGSDRDRGRHAHRPVSRANRHRPRGGGPQTSLPGEDQPRHARLPGREHGTHLLDLLKETEPSAGSRRTSEGSSGTTCGRSATRTGSP